MKTTSDFNLTLKEPSTNQPRIVEELDQSVHEEELVNQNGEFIIFNEDDSPELKSNPQSRGNSFITDMSYQFDINSVGPATPGLRGFDETADLLLSRLEPNFKKLNKTNKINILLKALIMERNKN